MLSAGCTMFVPSPVMRCWPAARTMPVPAAVFAVTVNAPVVLFTTVQSRVHAGKITCTFAVSAPASVIFDFNACAGVSVTFEFVSPLIAMTPYPYNGTHFEPGPVSGLSVLLSFRLNHAPCWSALMSTAPAG
ncbi:hypothetical protein WT27_23595 [Burkholderia territorii]|uniref:Uncharacterized protein n=1 Tax=Burkholderia territorii TaxID=1503055 RepID=A0A106EFG3_9BURK|nr:hypothetical protein WT27_23595 [Burkholderia territorii]KVX46817.1 hypothetical protein WT31_21265 [Burkholderia territorii]